MLANLLNKLIIIDILDMNICRQQHCLNCSNYCNKLAIQLFSILFIIQKEIFKDMLCTILKDVM